MKKEIKITYDELKKRVEYYGDYCTHRADPIDCESCPYNGRHCCHGLLNDAMWVLNHAEDKAETCDILEGVKAWAIIECDEHDCEDEIEIVICTEEEAAAICSDYRHDNYDYPYHDYSYRYDDIAAFKY